MPIGSFVTVVGVPAQNCQRPKLPQHTNRESLPLSLVSPVVAVGGRLLWLSKVLIGSRMISSVYRNGRDSTAFQSLEAELAGSGRRDFAVKNSYALQGDAQVLLVSTDEAGLGFSDE